MNWISITEPRCGQLYSTFPPALPPFPTKIDFSLFFSVIAWYVQIKLPHLMTNILCHPSVSDVSDSPSKIKLVRFALPNLIFHLFKMSRFQMVPHVLCLNLQLHFKIKFANMSRPHWLYNLRTNMPECHCQWFNLHSPSGFVPCIGTINLVFGFENYLLKLGFPSLRLVYSFWGLLYRRFSFFIKRFFFERPGLFLIRLFPLTCPAQLIWFWFRDNMSFSEFQGSTWYWDIIL